MKRYFGVYEMQCVGPGNRWERSKEPLYVVGGHRLSRQRAEKIIQKDLPWLGQVVAERKLIGPRGQPFIVGPYDEYRIYWRDSVAGK